MGKIIAICISEKKGTEKFEIEKGNLIENFGLENDAHAGNWHRQISLLDLKEIEEFNRKGGNVKFGDFGENIVIEGIDIKNLAIGSTLKIGESILEITQKGKECHHHCKIYYRVGDCIMPREGVFAKVIKGGEIKKGDQVEIMEKKLIKEACVGSYAEAVAACERGATRIELCDNLEEGGTTPSYGTIKKARGLAVPSFVIIRPRGGDFVYSSEEIEIMLDDIKMCKELGVLGVVLGVLNKENEIDYETLEKLVSAAKPMAITFHKAIDEIANPIKDIKKLATMGIDRILTSGTKVTAIEGKDILNEMIKEAEGKLKIVVAGRVTAENLDTIRELIPNEEYHGKKIV